MFSGFVLISKYENFWQLVEIRRDAQNDNQDKGLLFYKPILTIGI